jgi:nascent polypeptide-associated complex subunit alpha
LKPVEGVTRVTFTRGQANVYAIANPEVFKSVNSDTHIVFGEMQAEDMAAKQAAFAEQMAAENENQEGEAPALVEEAAEDDEEVDATGVEEKDIDLVVSQANVSRSKAIKALKNNENDVVNAIMELTM